MRVWVVGAAHTLRSLRGRASCAPWNSDNTQLLREQNAYELYFLRVPGPVAASPGNSPDGLNQRLRGRAWQSVLPVAPGHVCLCWSLRTAALGKHPEYSIFYWV